MGSSKYALWTTYFFVALFGLAAIVNGLQRLEILSRCVSASLFPPTLHVD